MPIKGLSNVQQNEVNQNSEPFTGVIPLFLVRDTLSELRKYCSYQDLLALSAVNKATFAKRFHIPELIHLRFQNKNAVDHFLVLCQKPTQNQPIRMLQDFMHIQSLTLSLFKKSQVKNHKVILNNLPNVNHLIIQIHNAFHNAQVQFISPLLSQVKKTLTSLEVSAERQGSVHIEPQGYYDSDGCYEDNPDYDPDDIRDKPDCFPDTLWQCVHLEKLHVFGSSIKKINQKINHLHKLNTLSFEVLINLASLPQDLTGLANLNHLTLSDLPELKNISGMAHLKQLKRLVLFKLPSINNIAVIVQLNQLEYVSLEKLAGVTKLPNHMGSLPNLHTLMIKKLKKLNDIMSMAKTNHLKSLTLKDLPKLPTTQIDYFIDHFLPELDLDFN